MKKLFYVIASVFILMGCGKKTDTEEAIRPVFYQKAEKKSAIEIRSFSGITQPQNEAKLSFKVGGTIEEIAVELGDTLRKGSPIAWLDDDDYRINYNKAKVSLKNAEVQLTAAKSTFLRIENLYAGNNVSLNEFEKAKAQYESAQAMVETAKEQVNAAKNQLDYTTLFAPYTGTISAVLAEENEITGTGRPVVAFSSIQIAEVKTTIPENVIGRIKTNTKVTVEFSVLPEKSFQGVISEISTGTPSSSSYPVIIKITDESSEQIRAGMTGTVKIPLQTDKSKAFITITPDAISHDQNGDFVYVARPTEEDGIFAAMRQEVTLGDLSPAGYEITEGLKAGEFVITAGIRFLYDGRKVKLLDDNNL